MNPPNPNLNPFPGLRSFQTEEDYLFFGREKQTWELLGLLGKHRFLAVVGTSGSGKSSLVRAGLLPALQGGTMNQAGSAWEIMVMRPGGDPVLNLARGLVESGLYDEEDPDVLSHLLATLRHNRLGLVDAARLSDLEPETNLLLVVDQFEELFRFGGEKGSGGEEAGSFTRLLLEASAQKEVPIYVVLTMRSDYLGDCANFPGLAEAVNRGEYLIPRLDRDQKKEAIEGPAKVGGGRVAPRLMQRLLNDLGHDPDQLPVLQHALMRTWDHWARDHAEGEPIDLRHYEGMGGVREALSRHADEVYEGLPDEPHRAVAARVFKALTEKGADNRGIRRPTRFDRLCSIVDADEGVVRRVVDEYRKSGVTFLMPPMEKPLEDETVVDISHESLMRVWVRLKGWVEEESQSARVYRRLAETALLYEEGKAGLYHEPDLGIALAWRKVNRPNESWARRYHPAFESAVRFLEESREETARLDKEREEARQRELEQARVLAEKAEALAEEQRRSARLFKRFGTAMGLVAILALVAFLFALRAQQRAEVAQAQAENAKAQAVALAEKSERILKEQFHEQGRSWLLKAQTAMDQKDFFAARMMAGRAVGYQGYGREQQDETFAASYPVLLLKDSTETEQARELLQTAEPLVPLRAISRLRHHSDWGRTLAFIDNGATLVSSGDDYAVRFWDVETGQLVRTYKNDSSHSWVIKIWINRAETMSIEAFGFGVLKFRDLASGLPTNTWQAIPRRAWLRDMSVSADESMLAVTDQERRLHVFDLPGRSLLWETQIAPQTGQDGTEGTDTIWADFSPDSRHLAVSSDQGLRLYDPRTGSLVKELPSLHATSAPRFSPDGTRLAVGVRNEGDEGELLILDVGRWEVTQRYPVGISELLDWSGEGRLLAMGGRSAISLLDLSAGRVVGRHVAPGLVGTGDLKFDPDAGNLAWVSDAGQVHVMDIQDPAALQDRLPHHLGSPQLVFTPSGEAIHFRERWMDFAGRLDLVSGEVDQFEFHGDRTISPFAGLLGAWVSSQNAHWFTASVDGSVIATVAGETGQIEFMSPDGKVLTAWQPPEGLDIRSFRYGLDGLSCFLVATLPGDQLVLQRWVSAEDPMNPLTMTNLLQEWRFAGRETSAWLAISDDTRYVAMGTREPHRLMLVDLVSGEERILSEDHHEAIAFNPQGTVLAAGSPGGVVTFWELPTGNEWGQLSGPDTYSDERWTRQIKANQLVFSPDGTILLVDYGWEGGTVMWDLSATTLSPERTRVVGSHARSIEVSSLSQDHMLLATGDSGGTIKLWSVQENGLALVHSLASTQRLSSLSISPNNRILAIGVFGDVSSEIPFDGESRVVLYDLNTRKVLRSMEAFSGRIRSLAFSPDGRLVAAGTETPGQGIKEWEVATGTLRHTREGGNQEGTTYDLAYSGDGKWLAAARAPALTLWNRSRGESRDVVIPEGEDQVRAARFSSDSRTLYVMLSDDSFRAWDMAEMKELWRSRDLDKRTARDEGTNGLTTMSIDATEARLVGSTGTGEIFFLDTRQGTLLRRKKLDDDGLRALAFVGRGDRLVAGLGEKELVEMRVPLFNGDEPLTSTLKLARPEGRKMEWHVPALSSNLYQVPRLETDYLSRQPLLHLLSSDLPEPERSLRRFHRFLRGGSLASARYYWERLPQEARRDADLVSLGRLVLKPRLNTLEAMARQLTQDGRRSEAVSILQMLAVLWVYERLGEAHDFDADQPFRFLEQLAQLGLEEDRRATLVAKGATWRYLDDGTDQGTAWRMNGFDDSNWASGSAPLGYGDPVATTISYGPESSNKHPCYYFRHAFEAGEIPRGYSLVLQLRRDDGAIVYLNGHEIVRDNLPVGEVTYDTKAVDVVGNQDEHTYFKFELHSGLLRPQAINLLAVELHQQNVGSSDVMFDLEASLEITPRDYLTQLHPHDRAAIVDRVAALLPVEWQGRWLDRFRFAWRETLPDPLPSDREEDVEAWIMRSRIQHFLGNPEEARRALARDLALRQSQPNADFNRFLEGQKQLQAILNGGSQ